MAETYSFFDAQQGSGGYDRTYSSADMARYFSSFVGNGVYASPANQLMVSPASGKMAVSVACGKAWILGYFYELSETPKELTVARGDANYSRYDLIVCSLSIGKRLIELKVIQGTPAANPQVPSFTHTPETWDLVLAQVTVAAGATSLTAADVKDCRPDSTKCGFVKGVIEQIDTTNLFAQYDSAFNTWFDTAKGQLSGDVAGNLTTQVSQLQAKFTEFDKNNTQEHEALNASIKGVKSSYDTVIKDMGQHDSRLKTLESKYKTGTSAAPSTGTPDTFYFQLLN